MTTTNPNDDARTRTDEALDAERNPSDSEYDNPGIAGQILYPEPEVDAERAAAFAGGKADTLYPEGDPRNVGWSSPADRSAEVVDEEGNRVTDEDDPRVNPAAERDTE